MKEQIKKMILEAMEAWEERDIYVISLFVYNDDDNPRKPTVTLGYNTEAQVAQEMENAWDEQEARWNYAFWLQNTYFCFGRDETAHVVEAWLAAEGLTEEEEDDGEAVTKAFADVLIQVVREIHKEGILTRKFGKELPILIHELEYYDEIAEQNIAANGREEIEDFIDFCTGY